MKRALICHNFVAIVLLRVQSVEPSLLNVASSSMIVMSMGCSGVMATSGLLETLDLKEQTCSETPPTSPTMPSVLPPLPQANECESIEVAEKVNVADLQNVVNIQPSIFMVRRCTGLCKTNYKHACRSIKVRQRNVTALVTYSDGICSKTKINLRDELTCGCGCDESVTCPAFTVRDNNTCNCFCPNEEPECGSDKEFDRLDCDCVCFNREESLTCGWKTVWDSNTCSCAYDFDRNDVLSLSLIVMALIIIILLTVICWVKRTNRQLQKIIDEDQTYGYSRNTLREYVKIRKNQGKEIPSWDYVNNY